MLLTLIITSCSNKDNNIPTEIVYTEFNVLKVINGFSNKLISRDTNQIKSITTDKGYKSILEWSDTLKNISFIEMLSNDLKNENIIYDLISDSEFEIHTGNNTGNKTNLPVGFLRFKEINGIYKIDGYSGE
jgi:hypothetical protein